jgi:nicotinamide-nucleotide amidase
VSEPVRRLLERAVRPVRRVLRFFGASESAVALALAESGGEADGVAATVCARDFEIHVELVVEERGRERAEQLAASLRERLGRWLFAEDERSVEQLVLESCRARGLLLAAAESCTGGLVAARLTSVPGASDVFAGGVVPYSNALKTALLGVPADLLERHGAVSAEAAAAMATGARERLGTDVAVAVTGIAGPGGGTPEKPVGLVYGHAEGPEGDEALELRLPGDRDAVRGRATAAALHLVRTLLAQNRDEDA